MTSLSKLEEASLVSPEALLSSLLDVVFRDGRHELDRAAGKRGSLKLSVEIELGDNGQPLHFRHSLYFEQRRHIKDGFR